MTNYSFLATHVRRISTFGSRLLKDAHQKGKEVKSEVATIEPCKMPPNAAKCPPPPAGSVNVCLVEHRSSVPIKPCNDAEVDPDWEMAEKQFPKGPRVVVIGAGLAGLTAAERLVRAGHNNLLILEADCRAGGRLRSSWAGDTVVDLGFGVSKRQSLSWNHPLLKAGLANGVIDPPAAGDPTCGILDPPPSLPVIFRAYAAIKGLLQEESCRKHLTGYKGLRIEQAGRAMPSSDRSNAAKVMAAMASLMGPKLQVVEDGFGAYVVAPGGTRVPLGESGMLIPLLEAVGKDKVLYRKEVVSIRWGTVTMAQLPRAIVRCRDGSEYPAEFVIISCSLGNLKNNMDSMFYPPLPTKKAMAIEKLGFIQENKAFLVFEEPIWTWSTKPVNIAFAPESNKDKVEGKEKEKSDKKSESKNKDFTCWSKGIVEIKQVEGSQKVICVKVEGAHAVQMERSTRDAVKEVLHAVLQDKLGIGDIPKPKDVIRSKWSDSRYFRGSHAAPGSANLRAELAAPLPCPDELPPILLFAGEATSSNHNPFQGAVMSGFREAERLLGILNALPKPMKDVCPTICK